jgi:cytochrome c
MRADGYRTAVTPCDDGGHTFCSPEKLPMPLRLVLIGAYLCLWPGFAHADGDVQAGAQVFKKCGGCHTASEPANRVGPSLMGVVGRPVAIFAGYGYSDAMRPSARTAKCGTKISLANIFSARKRW